MEIETLIEGRVEKDRTPRRRRVHHKHAADISDMTIEDKFVHEVSDWDRLVRWSRILQPKAERPTTRMIGADELKDAQSALFFLCQTKFRDDLNKCRDTYVNLAPVIDAKGFIRAEGRLGKLSLQPEVRHPIILPGNNPLVELYARRKHVRYLHQGNRVVLANIAKDGVHIGNGKELLKSVSNKCLYCRTRRESTANGNPTCISRKPEYTAIRCCRCLLFRSVPDESEPQHDNRVNCDDRDLYNNESHPLGVD